MTALRLPTAPDQRTSMPKPLLSSGHIVSLSGRVGPRAVEGMGLLSALRGDALAAAGGEAWYQRAGVRNDRVLVPGA